MESNSRPDFVSYKIVGGTKRFSINTNVVEVRVDWYEWDSYDIPLGKWDYSGIVDTLVQNKYPIDKMQAVINNYLLDPNDVFAVEEFNNMQAWRKEAKEIAKEALLYELH